MKPKTLKALKESIEQWKENSEETQRMVSIRDRFGLVKLRSVRRF